jgi:aryl-alcohol dehydrogenase-like predicted oxidoreductase
LAVNIGGVHLTRIGLGTNRLKNTDANRAFLRAAVDAGANFIDSAHLYTGGESERTIGDAFGGAPSGVAIATKGGFRGGSPEGLRAEIEESFERLRTDTIALYYLHRVDRKIGIETSLEVIKEYQDQGRVREIGISAVGIDEIERAQAVVRVAAVQNHYNLTARASEDVIDYCAEHGIVFVPYFPLRKLGRGPIKHIAARHDATPQQIALAWLLRRGATTAPIPGTLSLEHLRQNLAALEIELSDEEFQALR